MTSSGMMVVAFVAAGAGLLLLSYLIRTLNVPPFSTARHMLDVPVGVTIGVRPDPGDVYYRAYPRRLHLNGPALVLGPFWYVLTGLWAHASIMFTLIFLSGGLLLPVVWAYCGLKANEDLLEFRVARDSVY